jgi:acyl-coenzyme A synthetase/AMP-(fatty) acid ligase
MAQCLKALGVKAKRVFIYMPMCVEGGRSMLSLAARIGLSIPVVFGGFLPKQSRDVTVRQPLCGVRRQRFAQRQIGHR